MDMFQLLNLFYATFVTAASLEPKEHIVVSHTVSVVNLS